MVGRFFSFSVRWTLKNSPGFQVAEHRTRIWPLEISGSTFGDEILTSGVNQRKITFKLIVGITIRYFEDFVTGIVKITKNKNQLKKCEEKHVSCAGRGYIE